MTKITHSNNVLREELFASLQRWRFVFYVAYLRKKVSVRFSSFGFLLEPVFLLVSTFCIALVWNKLFGRGGGGEFWEFFVYILVSFGVWGFISDAVSLGANAFTKNSVQIVDSKDPVIMYVFTEQALALISFMLKIPAIIIVAWFIVGANVMSLVYLAFGTLLVALSGIGFGLTVGFLCLLYKDVRTLIDTVMRMAFLLTPIIWHVDRLGEYKHWIYLNPFYSYLAVCRDYFIEGRVGSTELLVAISLTSCLVTTGGFVLATKKLVIRQKAFEQ